MKIIFNIFTILIFITDLYSQTFNLNSGVVQAKHGMVVSAHEQASTVGVEILKKGGNAIDAAVAVGFALAVVFPEAGNVGGGGFMLIRLKDGTAIVVDFREVAPSLANSARFIDSLGNVSKDIVEGHSSTAVPGTVAGLILAQKKFGNLSISEVIQPAIKLAENGFIVDYRFEQSLEAYKEKLFKYPSTREVFFINGELIKAGNVFYQPDLAKTLLRIQETEGTDFYKGITSQLIVREMANGNGLITLSDLESYQPILREPLKGTYRDFEIITTPLPSSGGICLLQMLNILERFDIASLGYHSSRSVHIMAEAMKLAFADRAEFLGDPDFVKIPVNGLISKKYAEQQVKKIDTTKTTPSHNVTFIDPTLFENENTTHYVVIDSQGNIATVTYTLNDLWGNKIVVTGAGFLLNNEMDDFNVQVNVPNNYGLVNKKANIVEPKKRPLSSMTPTIVLKDDKPFMILGARGGPKIINAVLQTIVNVIDFGMNIRQSVEMPRFHHQYLPDELLLEKYALPFDVKNNLSSMGHTIKEITSTLGQLEAIYIDHNKGWIYGVPDSREGGVAVGY